MTLRGALGRIGTALRREDGSATIEFVILFPAIMTLFLSAFEVSTFLMRTVLLDRALDLTVRDLRLGNVMPQTGAELKRRVCAGTLVFPDCLAATAIELTPISTSTWNFPAVNYTCVDRDSTIAPVTTVAFGQANDVMLVRACAVLDPFFGTTPWVMGLHVDHTGGYTISAASTFVNEP